MRHCEDVVSWEEFCELQLTQWAPDIRVDLAVQYLGELWDVNERMNNNKGKELLLKMRQKQLLECLAEIPKDIQRIAKQVLNMRKRKEVNEE